MPGKKRWLIIGSLVLAQAAIVICYLELQTAAPARATAEQPAPQADREAVPADGLPVPQPASPGAAKKPAPAANAADVVAQLPTPPPASGVAESSKPAPVPTPAPPSDSGKAPPAPAKTADVPLPAGPPAPPGPPADGLKTAPEPAKQAEPTPPPPASGPPAAVPPVGSPEPPPPLPGPAPKASASPPPPTPVVCPWTFNLVIVHGRTVLTAKTGDEVQFKVSCDRLDLQAPHGAIQASGSIKLNSAGLEGAAERLTINLHEDRVILDGVARLKARRDGQELELQSDRLSLRIIDGHLSDRAEAAEQRPGL
jgi:hypothetical protein